MPEPAGDAKGARLSIGALSRATGIPAETQERVVDVVRSAVLTRV